MNKKPINRIKVISNGKRMRVQKKFTFITRGYTYILLYIVNNL